MARVEAVLGKDWAQHVEGQKLKQDGDSFKVKLNTSELFEDWCRKVKLYSRNLQNVHQLFSYQYSKLGLLVSCRNCSPFLSC